jgi:hypothetical protein
MKKLMFSLIFLVLALSLQAQTVSGYFVETTKGQVNAYGQNGYANGLTGLVTPGGAAYTIASKAFSTSADVVRNAFMGKKVIVGINITVAFADVSAALSLQISYDNTTWVTIATLDSDTTPNVTGVQLYLADFTSVYAPYARLLFNTGGDTINTTGRIKFLYSVPR